MILERSTREGDSPVIEKIEIFVFIFLSTTGHGEPCGNQGGPPSKAKYTLATDSEQVPWGKGEKYPERVVK